MKSSLERGKATKTVGRVVGIGLILVCLLIPVTAMGQAGVPPITNNDKNEFQIETHFLTFIGSFKPESAYSEKQYYLAIDPLDANGNDPKATFPQWLKKAGFIDDVNHWHSHGPQVIACDLGTAAGCDVPAHNPDGSLNYLDQHGVDDNVVNTDSHVIVLNAADLGFVRNQFIRCIDPSNPKNLNPCQSANPIMYTYLENYPVAPFAAGGTKFPFGNGYPTAAEAAAAISSALNRPLGQLTGKAFCDGQNFNAGACVERIADVAFEWIPPLSNPASSSRMGTLYAYIFQHTVDANGVSAITETLNLPNSFFDLPNLPVVGVDPKAAPLRYLDFAGGNSACPNGVCNTILAVPGDKFPPNLDFAGFKFHPGVCLVCHGGKPVSVTSPNPYPNHGNIDGFRFLPLDTRNLMFTSDLGPDQPAFPTSVAFTDRFNQEAQLKRYNQAVLRTIPTYKENDGTGAKRVAHARELITGWYTDPPPNTTPFNRSTQNPEFLPVGWREPKDGGTAPAGAEDLYHQVVSPSCRSCHLNRELSLDFGTYANFTQESDILQLALLPGCSITNPNDYSAQAGFRFMPLAHITYQRYWQANTSTGGGTQELPYPSSPPEAPLFISSTADQIANAPAYGFGTVAGYCATNP